MTKFEHDDGDMWWVPVSVFEAKLKECEALKEQVDQLREELGKIERRLVAWEVHGT